MTYRNQQIDQDFKNIKDHTQNKDIQMIPQGDAKAEVYFIGQIAGGVDFETTDGLFCEMLPDAGENWELLQPQQRTYITQTCYTEKGQMFVWGHPIDLHFAVNDMAGWPKAIFKIWRLDETNKIDILAYGTVPFPKTSGFHKIYCNTWSPIGDWKFGTLSFFLGNQPQIPSQGNQKNSVPYSIVNNDDRRQKLLGLSNGKVILELEVVLKNIDVVSNLEIQKKKQQASENNTNDERYKSFWEQKN